MGQSSREDITNRYQLLNTYDEVNSELIKIDSIDKKDIIRTFD
jgi:hypothetical protein